MCFEFSAAFWWRLLIVNFNRIYTQWDENESGSFLS